MVKATEHWRGGDATIGTNRVAGAPDHRTRPSRIGNTWAEARVRAALIVVRHPFGQNATEMPLVEWNHPIETLTTRRADHTFAMGVRLGHRHRCLQDTQSHRPQRQVHPFRLDTFAIVHNEAMCALASHARSELLDDPRRGWMFGYIPVHESARADVEHDEDVDQVEAGRHRHKEVAGEQLASMIAHERAPRLGRQSGFER